jgi:hypothetical protein
MSVAPRIEAMRPAKDARLDEPRFLLGDVAAAAGMSETVLKAWLSRDPKVIPLGPYDKPARGKGSAREFTLRRIISVALVAELVRLGISPGRAGPWAHALTDLNLGSLYVNWLDETTVLIASPSSEVFTFTNDAVSIAEALEKFNVSGKELLEPPASIAVVSYGAVLRRVQERLSARGKFDEEP